MVVKSRAKSKIKPKAKAKTKIKAKAKKIAKPAKMSSKKKPVRKAAAKSGKRFESKKTARPAKPKFKPAAFVEKPVTRSPVARPPEKIALRPTPVVRSAPLVKRALNPSMDRRPVPPRTPRIHQFSYMKAPGLEHAFEVGDTVEVFCDHEKNRERIRGWVKGIVVQVDNKLVAVQFRSNVFLTDGWMVPDRILWYPLNSEHIRPMPGKKSVKKDFVPDY